MTDIAPLDPFVSFKLVEFDAVLPEYGDPIYKQLEVLNQRMLKFDWEVNSIDGNVLTLYVLDGVDGNEWLNCLQALVKLTMVTFHRFDSFDAPRRSLTFKKLQLNSVFEEVETMGASDVPITARVFEFEFVAMIEQAM